MKIKLLSYISAFIVASYIVYLDYLFVQSTVGKIVQIFFPEIPRYSVHEFVTYLFLTTGAFVILFYLAYFIFYLYIKENEGSKLIPRFFPKVSIVIPAHNEAINIGRLLESIQYQDYPFECYEIIVVDDGSVDGTGEIAMRYGAKVIRHEKNVGKAKALEEGIKAAKGDVIITMDADSHFADGSSLRNIVEELFSRPFIGVSTGVLRIEKRTGKLIEKLQELEFLYSFDVGRRVQSYLDWLLVVPGAFSAFKSYFIKSLPTIPKDTLGEDFDLGMIAYRAGLTSSFEPHARIYTEPMESWRGLYKQRVRWYYGGLQVLAKHRDMILNRKYGERGIFLFFHMIFLEYFLPVLHVFGIVMFPSILILQNLLGFQIFDINVPMKVLVTVFLLVLLLQYLPSIFVSTLTIVMEWGSKHVLRYIPVIFLYHFLYNVILSFAKVDAIQKFLRRVPQSW
ncbi:MAG: poly-beta,6-N-acetyl-D-glucosamine synthase [Thermococcaceae archaeon]|jgi:cellulose synthase/poly-beta-1,6-N-acetylglucosamine synthase-like glycosyltransferase|uniref:glycosyltransferase n=1 Tax=Thermococcus bergensis TaxID=2689387 RepID=UPI001CED451B|nr:glycosyltransferase family 2 protein [Thermococcus bergensis]MCA6213936.1 glycosyltransferase [Thermococcus bergensis]MDN5321244.1 poly-beta,6-N-acetyl-D-glucosamine synthase [Thermococcaceae archaeon]